MWRLSLLNVLIVCVFIVLGVIEVYTKVPVLFIAIGILGVIALILAILDYRRK